MYPGRATCCRATCCCVVNAACNYVSMCLSVAQKTRGLSGESVRHVLMINVSPVEYGHVLLVPQLDCCLPQVHPHILRDLHREGERCGCNLSDSVQQRLVQVLNVLSVLVGSCHLQSSKSAVVFVVLKAAICAVQTDKH